MTCQNKREEQRIHICTNINVKIELNDIGVRVGWGGACVEREIDFYIHPKCEDLNTSNKFFFLCVFL